MPSFKPVIVTTTVSSPEEAERISMLLLEQRLAACVQAESIQSKYVWEGKICVDEEIRLTIKTARCHFGAIEKIILQNHGYECPQILMIPVHRGYKPYLRWLKQAVGC
ncbi:MAG: divalent-cation tolerance protein CutA [Neisseria sp.]|uniref:divalent-cation tolerance protein CutA n=1 Tax=Neisseria sp. TaxID=192066 RepID=UPI0026DCA1BB|nr:divalent-cation tolerance protein CutA [Neisseria sp.]MDO4641530.1 divalent-cation tolerance protein CutA [Neisseria sp.]